MDLEEAKDWLREKVKKGARCPCCSQFAKVYERRLYSSMAAALIVLYQHNRENGGQYIHKKTLLKHPSLAGTFGGGDFAKLEYWGLVKEKPKDSTCDSRTSGWWKITDKGIDFVLRRLSLMSHVKIYDGKLLGFSGKQITIDQCLGKKFSYLELMGRQVP